MKIFFLLLSLATEFYIFSLEGVIYNGESINKEVLYIQKISSDLIQNTLIHEYYDVDGALTAYEKYTKNSLGYDVYDFSIVTQGKIGTMKIYDDYVEILYNYENKVKSKNKKIKGDIITGPTMDNYIKTNFDIFLMGEERVAYLPSFDFLTLIPFKFVPTVIDNEQVQITMKLKNFLLGRLIEPVNFIYSIKDRKLIEIHGPTILPVPNSDSNKFINADIYYTEGEHLE